MQIKLDDDQVANIKTLVFGIVKDGIKQATNQRPYLNRKDIAKYFGVADSTIRNWALLGMPVAVIDGRKMYGKKSITAWLKSHEKSLKPGREQIKKPATMRVVTGRK